MSSNAQLALVGASGVGYTADSGTAAPIDFSALPAAWNDFGYISQDGMTAAVDESRTSWTPWGALSPIRTQVTSSTKTFAVTCWETNKTVLSLYHKIPQTSLTVPTTGPGAGILTIAEQDKPAPDRRAFVFDVMDGSTNLIRIYIPLGEVTEKGNVVYKSDDLVGYPLTISAYPGADGVAVQRFYKLAQLS
jgi:hypothetical protein